MHRKCVCVCEWLHLTSIPRWQAFGAMLAKTNRRWGQMSTISPQSVMSIPFYFSWSDTFSLLKLSITFPLSIYICRYISTMCLHSCNLTHTHSHWNWMSHVSLSPYIFVFVPKPHTHIYIYIYIYIYTRICAYIKGRWMCKWNCFLIYCAYICGY